VQDDIRVSNRVTADLGVRLDRYDLVVTATHASPRLNLAVEVGGGAVVHASYNHFFVPPPVEGVLSSAAGLTSRIRELGIALPPVQPTTEDQFELGASSPAGPFQLGLTGYYRASNNPVHTTVRPDARIYSYASFDRAQAYGLEMKTEIPRLTRYGLNGYFNYALGRVYFYNPVTGGFVTEAEHLNSADRFLAPMDQTHTLTAGLTYRHSRSGLWIGTAVEYGSGTPTEHGDSEDVHAEGDPTHTADCR
jgi:outer membrane receptor protein involved in Fe transport